MRITLKYLAVGSLALTSAACSFLQPQPDLSRFFVLTPMAEPAAQPAAEPLRLGLGPIEFPAYLQRSPMVTRVGPNEIALSQLYRWGEPLKENFARVLSQNLAEILATNQIVLHPWYSTQELDYAIRINLTQFDVDTQGEARLLARWRIVDAAGDKMLRTGMADLQQQAADSSPDAAVAALSQLIETFSRELARGVETLRR